MKNVTVLSEECSLHCTDFIELPSKSHVTLHLSAEFLLRKIYASQMREEEKKSALSSKKKNIPGK